jgi:hypothetical protein
MKTLRQSFLVMIALVMTGATVTSVYGDQGDPPARVARLSFAQGKVSFQPSGETTWSEASVNRPVTTGDRIYTDPGASAELEVGPFAVRLAGATDVTLANLTDQIMQLGVGQGSVRVTLYEMPTDNSVEVDTPNGALLLKSSGAYRIDTAADGNSTQVTVNAGNLDISAGELSKSLETGQAVKLNGTGPVTAVDAAVPPPDDFDKWCATRDRRVEDSPSVKAVGPAVPGDEDLDAHGVWTEKPDYGQVWVPSDVPAGWVPYRNGQWVFVEPWGWTWVEAEPWGYAPFHYGRWVLIGGAWAWVPGPPVVRPVYAPALVAFVGGPGFSVGIGIGVQAWFPLGPREPFMPWYHYGPTYLHGVNVVTVTDITTVHYMNRGVAVTAVSSETFRSGMPVAHAMVHVPAEQLAHAEVVPHPEVSPEARAVFGARTVAAPPVHTAAFVRASGGPAAGFHPAAPSEAMRTGGPPAKPFPHMFTRNAPGATNAPFAARQDAYAAHPGRPLEPQQMNNLRDGKPAGSMQDKESPPHSAPSKTTTSKPSSSSSHTEHH